MQTNIVGSFTENLFSDTSSVCDFDLTKQKFLNKLRGNKLKYKRYQKSPF